jgi:multidrug resistance protein, MATE family
LIVICAMKLIEQKQPLYQRLWKSARLRTEVALLFTLALPLLFAELSSMLMGVAGTMMAGRIGETALAASGIAGVIYVVSMLLTWGGLRMVPTPVAEAHELRDGVRVRTLVGASMVLGVIFTVICCVLMAIGTHFFHFLGQDPEVERLAVDYLHYIIISMPVLVFFGVFVNLMDAFSFVKVTMVLSIIGLGVDVTLNWLLMFGRYGLPNMGISAIAMNMGITHGLMALVLVVILWRHPTFAYFRQARTEWSAVWQQTVFFFKNGVVSALQMLVEFSAFGMGTIWIGQINKTEQAAHQIALNLASVTYVAILGVSTAGMIRVGQALAYNSRVRVWLAGVSALVLSTLLILLPTLLFFLAPRLLAGLYIQDEAVLSVAITLLFYAALFQLADATQATSISLLRALNDVLAPSIQSFVAFWVIGLPFGYWLAHAQGWNAKGIWMGYLVALLIQAFLFVRRFFKLVNQPFGKV